MKTPYWYPVYMYPMYAYGYYYYDPWTGYYVWE